MADTIEKWEPSQYERQIRQDRARVEALKQAVILAAHDETADDVVKTAKVFEKYLYQIND